MTTACNQTTFAFHPLGQRPVVAQFDGGKITSDAGGLLLRETERVTGILRQFAACFQDYRNPDLIEHTVEELIGQRVYALALGYEDLNDHDDLRHDPLLAVLVGKQDPLGQDRRREEDRGKAEHLEKGSNPRCVVTSLSAEAMAAQTLYEQEYWARGDMENRIKEQQLGLFPLVRESFLAPTPAGIPSRVSACEKGFSHEQHEHHAGQRASVVVLVGGLSADVGLEAVGFEGDGVGQGPVRHDSGEVAEDRSLDPGECSAHLGVAGGEWSVPTALRPGVSPSGAGRAHAVALLSGAGGGRGGIAYPSKTARGEGLSASRISG